MIYSSVTRGTVPKHNYFACLVKGLIYLLEHLWVVPVTFMITGCISLLVSFFVFIIAGFLYFIYCCCLFPTETWSFILSPSGYIPHFVKSTFIERWDSNWSDLLYIMGFAVTFAVIATGSLFGIFALLHILFAGNLGRTIANKYRAIKSWANKRC